jgi:hypothetical protein
MVFVGSAFDHFADDARTLEVGSSLAARIVPGHVRESICCFILATFLITF